VFILDARSHEDRMNRPTPPPKTYSKIQAAVELGLPVKKIAVLIQEGKLKTIDLPTMARPRITEASVRELYAEVYGEPAKV
jgi:hypothetical protein